jgi:outer membrane receptor protein involved in Fe transport
MNGGLTAQFPNGFSVGLRGRFLDDRPATEDRTLTARGYFLLDLLAKYRWRNLEASLALLNLTDTDWREAQFSDNTCCAARARPHSGLRPASREADDARGRAAARHPLHAREPVQCAGRNQGVL